MPNLVEVKTFEDVLTAIIELGKISTSLADLETGEPTTATALRRYVNERYKKVAFAKKWPWRENTRMLISEPKYETGTASVTNGQREVDLSAAATIDSSFKGRYFRVTTDQEYYEIISVHDVTNGKFMLSAPYKGTTNATTTYVIFKNRYGLYPDFADIIEVVPSGTTSIFQPFPLQEITSEDMSKLQAVHPFQETQFPTHYTIQGVLNYSGPPMGSNFIMGYDFMGSTEEQALVLFPNFFNQSAIQIKYGIQVPMLDDLTDEPMIPKEKRFILVLGGLAEWYTLQGKANLAEYYDKKFNTFLSKMLSDFDRTETTVRLIAQRPGRRRLATYRRIFPESS